MSDAPQGPGWWQASDGRWYPPQPSPQPVPQPAQQSASPPPLGTPPVAPPAGSPFGAPQQPGYIVPPAPNTSGTNGLAIASLVLAIVWLCGVGSLLGIVFGIVALSMISKKPGQSGRGMAIAGIVVGALGLLITVGVFVAIRLGAEEIRDNLGRSSERDDVRIVSCGTDASTGLPTAALTITNDSSKTSLYSITVQFTRGGRTVTGTDALSITLTPNQTLDVDINAVESLPGEGDVDCDLGFVDRAATES